MDRYRSSQLQSLNAAALHIGTPRPLRPHVHNEERTPASTARSHMPLAYTPVIPAQMLSDPPESSYSSPAGPPPHIYTPGPGQTDLSVHPNDPSEGTQAERGFFRGVMHGLRRIPRAMGKHHSRQSLHEEYMAEAAAARWSQMSPNQELRDIPESVEGEGTAVQSESPLRGPSSSETYDDGTTAVHHEFSRPNMMWPINSPAYTNSQLDSRTSKAESSMGPLPPADTWDYYMARIVLFFSHIWNLPWSSPRIVNDYVPARDGRGHYGERKPITEWYKPKRRNSRRDAEKASSLSPPAVVVVPATPQSSYLSSAYGYGGARMHIPMPAPPMPMGPPVIPSPYSDGAVTAIRPLRSPMSGTSAGMGYSSPGMSSHGQGRHELSYSWYSSSPQPWPPYTSDMSPAQTRMTMGTELYGTP